MIDFKKYYCNKCGKEIDDEDTGFDIYCKCGELDNGRV